MNASYHTSAHHDTSEKSRLNICLCIANLQIRNFIHRIIFVWQNLEWKAKNVELDQDTEKLHRMIAAIAENLKAKISYALELSKYANPINTTVMVVN